MALSKNLGNGQVVTYTKDDKYKKYCFIDASKIIRKKASSLSIKKDNPIAVFTEIRNGKKRTCYVDDIHIYSLSQEVAASIYEIRNNKESSLFTTH